MFKLVKKILSKIGLWYIPPIDITQEEATQLFNVTARLEAAERMLSGNTDNIREAITAYEDAFYTYQETWNAVRTKYDITARKIGLDTMTNKLIIY